MKAINEQLKIYLKELLRVMVSWFHYRKQFWSNSPIFRRKEMAEKSRQWFSSSNL